jgi:hypothetical protein
MEERNEAWMRHYDLAHSPYQWDLETATLTFKRSDNRGELVSHVQLIGTASSQHGSFLWSWANHTLPVSCYVEVERVRAFGEEHDLPLLTTKEWLGGRAEGLEMLAVAGRILDAVGVFVDGSSDPIFLFVICNFEDGSAASV